MSAVRRSLRCIALLAFVGSAAGCSLPDHGKPDLLKFVVDGTTLRDEAISRLGEPSLRLREDSLCTWRIGQDKGGQYVIQKNGPYWNDIQYSLVLAFDAGGLLSRHALVDVRMP